MPSLSKACLHVENTRKVKYNPCSQYACMCYCKPVCACVLHLCVCLCVSVSPCSQLSGGIWQLAILATQSMGESRLTGRLCTQVCICAGPWWESAGTNRGKGIFGKRKQYLGRGREGNNTGVCMYPSVHGELDLVTFGVSTSVGGAKDRQEVSVLSQPALPMCLSQHKAH